MPSTQDDSVGLRDGWSSTPVIAISELVRSVRDALEHRFPLMWVSGEISNFTRAASGHCYFTLKDSQAQARCVLFRNRAQLLGWQPDNGVKVEVRALVTMYEARGEFQLNAETIRRAGLGPLFEKFLRLKEKLEREGLFDPAAKRPLPEYPRTVGVITSLSAAALLDILTTLKRRNPAIGAIVYPVAVQGDDAAAQIAAMLARAGTRAECDVLLLARGGGSIEDLWAFNEEAVARAIRACAIPVVTGVGHETDFTIADFAADLRAPTPTAAAESVSPERARLAAGVEQLALRAQRAILRAVEDQMQRVDFLARRLVHPRERLAAHARLLTQLEARLAAASGRVVESARWRLAELLRSLGYGSERRLARTQERVTRLAATLGNLDPAAVLARGYSITRAADGSVLREASRIEVGASISTTLARGFIESQVRRRG
ncbi:MAG: exodeoxyribonuclease VII large subunit [Betaproteobacteria bacterium]|nr:exodeoxyribonuclease VII large subunit [Betaproteobacteria bacterium]